jgi:hypothetical protein
MSGCRTSTVMFGMLRSTCAPTRWFIAIVSCGKPFQRRLTLTLNVILRGGWDRMTASAPSRIACSSGSTRFTGLNDEMPKTSFRRSATCSYGSLPRAMYRRPYVRMNVSPGNARSACCTCFSISVSKRLRLRPFTVISPSRIKIWSNVNDGLPFFAAASACAARSPTVRAARRCSPRRARRPC